MDKDLNIAKAALFFSGPFLYISVIVGLILYFIFSNPSFIFYGFIIGFVLLFISFCFFSFLFLVFGKDENNSK